MATALLKLTDVQLGSSVTATNNFTFYQPSTPDGTVRIGNGNSGSATDIMTLNSSGNVGIGTSSPAMAFHVVKDWTATKATIGAQTVTAFASGGNAGYGIFDSDGSRSAYLNVSSDALNVVCQANKPMAFATNNTERMRLDSSGNLGLGVTPSAWSVWGSVLQGNAYSITGYNSGGNVQAQFWMNSYRHSSGNPYYVSNGAASSYAQNNGTHYWNIAPSGTAGSAITFTQAMTLDASGNLGIGTSSPNLQAAGNGNVLSILGVNGSTAVNKRGILELATNQTPAADNNAGEINGIQVGNSGDVRISAILSTVEGSGGASGFGGRVTISTKADNGSLTERMRIDSSGNVGIGTSSPNHILTMYRGAGIAAYAAFTGNAAATPFLVGMDASGLPRLYTDSQAITFWPGGAERMRIDSSGNVLIGETSFLQSGNQGLGVKWSYANAGNGGQGGVEFYNASTSSNSDGNPALVISKGSTTTTSSARFIQFYCNVTAQPMGGIVGNGATNVQFASLSDAREKSNIEPVVGSLEKIVALNPVSFDWNVDGSHVNAGFVAQDVQQVFPEFVIENIANGGEEERLGLTGGMTGGIIAHLVAAIKELNAKVESLESQLKGQA